jgi:hypothetical protein
MIKVSRLNVPPNALLAADAAVLRASDHRGDDTEMVTPANYRPIVELVSSMPEGSPYFFTHPPIADIASAMVEKVESVTGAGSAC